MNSMRLAVVHRALRRRLGVTQYSLSRASGVPRAKISQLENHRLAKVTVPEIERLFDAMGARIGFSVFGLGADLDRLLDEGHALMAGRVAKILRAKGWQCEFEVTFSMRGDRGSIDILAWKAAERALLVIEIKTEIGALDGLLRPLDIKVRVAPTVARERFGWNAALLGHVVALPENSTARRTVSRHSTVLDEALPMRSRAFRRWIAKPNASIRALWFLSSAETAGISRNPSSIKRVRSRPASTDSGATGHQDERPRP